MKTSLLMPNTTPSQPRVFENFRMSGTLLALGAFAGSQGQGRAAEESPAPTTGATVLPDVVVHGAAANPYPNGTLSSPKYTVPARDVPQTITVIPATLMQEQGSSSLRDILKNVPGISIQAGEGGVPPGDNLSIRGFNARTDVFIDGVRDFGGYSRDPFNIEQAEISKGPSSTQGGRGSTGGSINLVSKTPNLERSGELATGIGSNAYLRSPLDYNSPIAKLEGAAWRLNGVFHSQETAGRDASDQQRWGLAPSLAFGFGTPTTLTLSYFHLSQDNQPDYGLPWVPRTNNQTGLASGIPQGVNFSNSYHLSNRDYERYQTDIGTLTLSHAFNDSLTLSSTTRLGATETELSVTAPRFDNSGADAAEVRRTDWKNRDQNDRVIANNSTLRYDFSTGSIEHQLVAALDLSRETQNNHPLMDRNAAAAPNTSLYHPAPDGLGYSPDIIASGAVNESTADTIALSLFDTIALTRHWQVSGGLRWDYFDVEYHSRTADSAGNIENQLGRVDKMFSYRGALTYKPAENGSIYIGGGTSFNPAAEGLSLSESATANNNVNLEPEKNTSFEIGTKWDLLDEKLSLTAAIFRTDKSNARTEDPTDPSDVVTLDGEQRVQGLEFGLSGQLTDNLRISGGYTFLDSEILSSNNPFEVGNSVANTPEHSFSLWTVWTLPAGFELACGAQYVGERYNNNRSDTRQEAPSYITFDSMVSYRMNDQVSFQLNFYNLGDEKYIDRLGGGHFIPGQGRSAVISARVTF